MKLQDEEEAVIKALRNVILPRLSETAASLFGQLIRDFWPDCKVALGFDGRKSSAMALSARPHSVDMALSSMSMMQKMKKGDSRSASVALLATNEARLNANIMPHLKSLKPFRGKI